MRKTIIIAGIFGTVLLAHACRKKAVENPVYAPTAQTIEVPAYVEKYVGKIQEPTDNPTTKEGVLLGRKLFYEVMLSNDNTMSCASCHKQENAFDDPRRFSLGTNGTAGTRNAMAIVNAAWENHLFWDGRRSTLEGQAHDPVTNPIEMANNWPEVVRRLQASSVYPPLFFSAFGSQTIDSTMVVKAIAQFERTLVSFGSRFDKYFYGGDTTVFNQSEKNGFAIFTGKGLCNNCHLMNTLLTDRDLKNNGLDDNPADDGLMNFTGKTTDRGKFKVPTLRNIGVTAPYMHDGRFATLTDVVNFYSSGVRQGSPNLDEHMPDFGSGLNLTNEEKADLVAFMNTLTDQAFLTDARFSDPN